MLSLKSPENIPGLNFWLDASDASTINNGRVVNNQNVFSFRDKINGIELKNNFGALGPSYSFESVNGLNAISMPHYTIGDSCTKGLTASNLTQFDVLTFSMFCVYKPMTTINADITGNQKYVVAIYSKTRMDALIGSPASVGPGGFANRAIYTGDEADSDDPANATRRLNPSGRYIEANTAVIQDGYTTYNTYGEHTTSRHGVDPSSLGKTCLTVVRNQNNLKKMSFIFNGSEIIDDFMGGTYVKPYVVRGNKFSGRIETVGNQATICIGSSWNGGKNSTSKAYPLEGFFCEFLHYNRNLTDTEYRSVRTYLEKKWIR